MFQRKLILATLSLGIATPILAGGLMAPFSLPSAKVLPKGVRNITYKGIYLQGNNKFSNSGQKVALGDSFNSDLTFQDLVENESTESAQASAAALIQSLGYDLNQGIGGSTGKLNVAVNTHTPIIAYGISKKLTGAIAIPIISSKTSVDVGSVSNNTFQGAIDKATLSGYGNISKAAEIQKKYANATNNKISDYGYKPLENESKTELGDVKLVAKYQLVNKPLYRLSLDGTTTLPTGREKDVNKVVDVASGDGQSDIGLGLSGDFHLSSKFTLSAAASYTAQLKDSEELRIPIKEDSQLSPDIDPNVRRNLGDIIATHAGGSVSIFEALSFGTAYSYQRKSADSYEGTLYSSERYGWLSKNSKQEMHSILASISYDTISAYRKKKFAIPMEATLNYSHVLQGKNVISDPVTTFDLKIYF